MKDNKVNSSGYVPASDEQGIRKTFTTPETIDTRPRSIIKTKYPFETIRIGESFPILYSEMKEKSVNPYVSKMGRKYGKKFKVTKFDNYQSYLISCIPMTETEAVATSSNVVEALGKLRE